MFGAAIQIRDSAPATTWRHAINFPSCDQAGLNTDPATRAWPVCAPADAASAITAMKKATPCLTGNIEPDDDRPPAAEPRLSPASGGTAALVVRFEHVCHRVSAARPCGDALGGERRLRQRSALHADACVQPR